jgi:hypothetical protein
MSTDPKNTPEEVQKLFRLHDLATAAFRAELAQRSAGEVLYDDCLLAQMRNGKPFKIALQKANAKFPNEALNPGSAELVDTEAHFQFFLDMVKMDEYRRRIEECQQHIGKTDREIATVLETLERDEGKAGPANPPEAQ